MNINNKKGQGGMLTIVIAIIIFISGMLMMNFLMPEITTFRNSDNFDCSNAENITDGMKLSCLLGGAVIPYFILVIISFAGGIVIDNLIS